MGVATCMAEIVKNQLRIDISWRLPECKKLKIWLKPVDSSDLGSII
jgi:hypothetical protein